MMLMEEPDIQVEVAYARADEQKIIALSVKQGTTVLGAARASGIVDYFPQIDLDPAKLGLVGKVVLNPAQQVVRAGERVEIYRPLIADPKEVRKLRAQRAKQNRSAEDAKPAGEEKPGAAP